MASPAAVLKAELLTAKLNLARGATHGEAIDHACLYRAADRVSDVIDRAHAFRTLGEPGRDCPQHATGEQRVKTMMQLSSAQLSSR